MMKKLRILIYISIFVLSFSITDSVSASTSFQTCTFSEKSYIRDNPDGTPLKDVDGQSVVVGSPDRAEVLESKSVNGKGFKKIKINYYSNNYVGWVYDGYLKDFKSFTTDDNYSNKLKEAGFPDSYILPLSKLHAIHPNWNFIVSKNGSGIDWTTAINGEYSPVYKNLICTNNLNAVKPLLSTDGSVYNTGNYKAFDNGSCYAPSKQTIAFYMDPRNWLNDITIFMFEQLSFNNELHNVNGISNMLKGTFMDSSFVYNNSNITYAQTFFNAGKQSNVSPVHLASRVLQEQGTTGSATYKMQDGNNTYYNLFNINATGNSSQEIIQRALSTAKANNWTNPYSSILGGASTISNGYINVGQDVLYYQKFNTINNSSIYYNQYMANVRVSTTESRNVYNAYRNLGRTDSDIIFKIPVYNNMPAETNLSTTNNADNTLSDLQVTNCTFNQSFNSAVTNYNCFIDSNIRETNIIAKPTSSFSSVRGNGSVTIDSNKSVQIVVTAANGESRTYTINIYKITSSEQSPSNIISSLGFNNNSNYISGVNFKTDISSIISSVNNKYPSANIKVVNKNNESKTNGIIATGDKITITSNNQTETFTVYVKGDINGDGDIDISDLAMVKSRLLEKITFSNDKALAADINNDKSVDISDLAMIKGYLLGRTNIRQ